MVEEIGNEQAVPLHRHTGGKIKPGGGARTVQEAFRAAGHRGDLPRAQYDHADTIVRAIGNEQAVPLYRHAGGIFELGGGARPVRKAIRAITGHCGDHLCVGSERVQAPHKHHRQNQYEPSADQAPGKVHSENIGYLRRKLQLNLLQQRYRKIKILSNTTILPCFTSTIGQVRPYPLPLMIP